MQSAVQPHHIFDFLHSHASLLGNGASHHQRLCAFASEASIISVGLLAWAWVPSHSSGACRNRSARAGHRLPFVQLPSLQKGWEVGVPSASPGGFFGVQLHRAAGPGSTHLGSSWASRLWRLGATWEAREGKSGIPTWMGARPKKHEKRVSLPANPDQKVFPNNLAHFTD